ncbi:hypothetical protein PtrEW4_000174, partial [Pyrenophora tritici-repentis]
ITSNQDTHAEEQIPPPGIMQTNNNQELNLTYTDPQPRDGGAPNPGAMFSLSTMAGDEAQPRDGG